jgi:hypothetical protein
MAINMQLRTEHFGELIEDGGIIESRDLPAYDDERFPYLRLVDPYGDTMFGRYQMVAVIAELEVLFLEKPSPVVDRLLVLARRCGIHEYLWFLGD